MPTKKFDKKLVKIKVLKSLNLELLEQSKGSQMVFENSIPLLCILVFLCSFFACVWLSSHDGGERRGCILFAFEV